MKKYLAVSTLLLLLTSFVYQHADKIKFKQLHVLEGKWIMKTKRGSMGEEWVKVSESHLQNRGFYIKGTDTVVTETVALKDTPEGIFYTSTVADQNNQQPVSFKLTSSEKDEFIFENTAHDFPKRIIYHLISADSIHAYIDGGVNGGGKRQDFY